jgi:two-component system, chemotaxis family, sensor kinase CheA
MSVELDTELLNVFLVEARELLERLGEQLVELEVKPRDTELLNAVFRAFHTVKGGAGFLALDAMVGLCHCAEDLLNEARNGAVLLNAGHMDALLEALDLLNDMMRAVDAVEPLVAAPPSLLKRLQLPGRAVEPARAPVLAVAANTRATPAPGAVRPMPVLSDDPVDAEFDALLAEARNDRPAPASGAGAGAGASDAINDDEFEALLDSLYGAGNAPGNSEVAPVEEVFIPNQPAPPIGDDEFEALLDSLYGQGKAPGADETPSTQAPVTAVAPEKKHVEPAVSTPAPAPVAKADAPRAAPVEATVRVDTARLDSLVNAAGELVLVRNRLSSLAAHGVGDPMERAVGELERVAADLQNAVLRMRMQPIGKLFQRFPRIIRDLARQLGKEVELVQEGEETDLDRTVVEALADPLIHLLRNAVDHGIEEPEVRDRAGKPRQGRVLLSAGQYGDHILITVADDGRGMDPEVLRRKAVEKGLLDAEQAARLDEHECYELVFRPGFSTRSEVSDISGRGVGMDVVKTKIIELGGTLAIDSRIGGGSEVRLSVPLTLAILRVLMVRVGTRLLALPLTNVAEVFELVDGQIQVLDGRVVAAHRNRALPLCDLSGWAGVSSGGRHVVVVHIGHQKLGCLVDEVLGREDVMAKPLGALLKDVAGIAGATITGDGRIALVLDLAGLADASGQLLPSLRATI